VHAWLYSDHSLVPELMGFALLESRSLWHSCNFVQMLDCPTKNYQFLWKQRLGKSHSCFDRCWDYHHLNILGFKMIGEVGIGSHWN
jgi:hypothetical protein